MTMFAANAITSEDMPTFLHFQSVATSHMPRQTDPEWKFLDEILAIDLKGHAKIDDYSKTVRALLNKALTLAIKDRSFDAIKDILRYGSKKLLTYRIQLEDMEHLIRHEAYSTINTLVSASVQIERPNSD